MASEAKLVGAPPLPAIDVERVRRKPANRAATVKSFVVTFFAVVVLAAFLSPMLRTVTTALKSTDQTHRQLAAVAGRLRDLRYEGEVYDVSTSDARRDDARSCAGRQGRQESQLIARRIQATGSSRAGLMAGARSSWTLARRSNFATCGRSSISTTAVHTGGAGRDRHIGRSSRASWWPRLARFPLPRTQPASCCCCRRSSCRGRHPDPDLHDLRPARMGRHVAAPAGARVLRQRV